MITQIMIKYLKLNWKNNVAWDLDRECDCAYIWTKIKATTSPKEIIAK